VIKVAVVGRGAIGGPIIAALAAGARPGAELAGVLVPQVRAAHETDSLEALLALGPDLVIEAAGHAAAKAIAEPVIASGANLLLFSVGALADLDFEVACRTAVSRRSAGRLSISTGAIGGIDMLKSLAASQTLRSVRLNSTTRPASLVQPWMDAARAEEIRATQTPMSVFAGSAREASQRFPTIANVAATVGLASLGLDNVDVEVRADPASPASATKSRRYRMKRAARSLLKTPHLRAIRGPAPSPLMRRCG
jgi:aspartate dehydrogenase